MARLLDLVNQDRAGHGLGPVALDGTLNAIAQAQANAMAAAHRIFQNPAFPSDVPGANAAGENVGYGPDVDQVHAAFVASPEHQVIIVGAQYHLVGIAVAPSSIGLMVVEDFVDTTGAPVIAVPPPPPPPRAPAPKPAPPVVVAPVARTPAPPPAPSKPQVAPPAPVAVPTPTPSPLPPPPPPPPAFDVALYTRMLQWDQWQTGTSTGA